MLKKIILIVTAALGAVLGVVGLAKNSKKLRARRMIKRIGNAMYTAGTMLRTLSMQTVAQ
jgi:hypothetical protein